MQNDSQGTIPPLTDRPAAQPRTASTQEDQLGDRIGEMKDQIKARTKEGVDSARHLASDTADRVRDIGRSGLESGAGVLASRVDRLSDRADKVSDSLRQNDLDGLAAHTDRISDRLTSTSRELRDKSADELLRDISHYARNNPGLFVLGGVAIGFALARIMKSNSAQYEREGRFQSAQGHSQQRTMGDAARAGADHPDDAWPDPATPSARRSGHDDR